MDLCDNNACPFCPGIPEDELHFVFDCKAYEHLRKTCPLFQTEIMERRNLTNVLKSENIQILSSFAKYLAHANNIRKKGLMNEIDE